MAKVKYDPTEDWELQRSFSQDGKITTFIFRSIEERRMDKNMVHLGINIKAKSIEEAWKQLDHSPNWKRFGLLKDSENNDNE